MNVTEYTRALVADICFRFNQEVEFYTLVDRAEMILVNLGPARTNVIAALPYEVAFHATMVKIIFDRAVSRIYPDMRGEIGRQASSYLVEPRDRTRGG